MKWRKPRKQVAKGSTLPTDSAPATSSKAEESKTMDLNKFYTDDIPAFLIDQEKLESYLKDKFPGKWRCDVRFKYLVTRGDMNTDTILVGR
jgi:hypothetical protein